MSFGLHEIPNACMAWQTLGQCRSWAREHGGSRGSYRSWPLALWANAIKDYAGGRNRSNNAGLLLVILSRYCTIVSSAILNREIKVKVEWNQRREKEREEEGGGQRGDRSLEQLYKAICGLPVNIPKADLHRWKVDHAHLCYVERISLLSWEPRIFTRKRNVRGDQETWKFLSPWSPRLPKITQSVPAMERGWFFLYRVFLCTLPFPPSRSAPFADG